MSNKQFIAYYQENFSAMENFAKKLTKNSNDAKDLVQEATFRAYRGMHTFRTGTNFKSWVFTILKNTFITKYNRRKKRGVVNASIEDFTFALKNNYSVRNDAISKLRVNEIKGCIKQLSTKSKKPFLMHIQGFQYNEIAESLGIPIGTVKSRINFARTKLKNIMARNDINQAA
jgi:RNA polymerase sigma-70 factor (ECF subfamily)